MKLEHCEKCKKLLPECKTCQGVLYFNKKLPADHVSHYDFDYKIQFTEDGNSETHLYCRDCYSKVKFDLKWRKFIAEEQK